MANHGFITSKKFLKHDEIFSMLNEINTRRFRGLLIIEQQRDYWFITHDNIYGFSIWIRSKRKLETRPSYREWQHYVYAVFIDELAAKLDGLISDEGVSEKWRGDPAKYASYKDWIEKTFEPWYDKDDPECMKTVEYLTALKLSSEPEQFKGC